MTLPLRRLLLCSLLISSVSAQQVPFRLYDTRDGLPRSAVRTLCQDSLGFLWFGTTSGAARYDAASFLTVNQAAGLSDDFINHFLAEPDGSVWIATNYGGLSRFTDAGIRTCFVDSVHRTSAVNRINLIVRYDAHCFLIATDGGAFRFDGNEFRPLAGLKPLFPLGIGVLFRDAMGRVWAGGPDGLALLEQPESGAATWHSTLGGLDVRSLAQTPDGTIWIGTDAGLRLIRSPSQTGTPPVPVLPEGRLLPLRDHFVRSLRQDPDGSVWIATDLAGVYHDDLHGGLLHFSIANGLPSNSVYDVLRDREENLWIATAAGVARLLTPNITTYTRREGLPEDGASAIVEDAGGTLWLGGKNGLSSMRGGSISRSSASAGLALPIVHSLLCGKNGDLWAGGGRAVIRMTGGTGRRNFLLYREQEGLQDWPARVVAEDQDGSIWLGCNNRISVFTHGKFASFPLRSKSEGELVLCIVFDDHEGVWVGLQAGGLLRFRKTRAANGTIALQEVARYDKRNGLPDDNIRCGRRDSKGALWFGTRFRGAFRVTFAGPESVSVRSYTVADGLSGNFVRALLEDSRGAMWCGTDRGADRIIADTKDTPDIRSLSSLEGAAVEDILDCFEDREGHIWFASPNGVTRFTPGALPPPPVPPPVYITQFLVFGKPERSGTMRSMSASLDYDQHTVGFEFIGVSFQDETANRYHYFLEGLEKEWGPSVDRRYASYTHLPPGEYNFRVSSRNRDGIWSISPATFSFTIARPFWSSAWFLAGTTVAVLLVIVGIHRYRVRRILEMERVRSKIATDLHDDLGSTLGSIQIFSEMARQEVENVAPHAAHLIERVGESSRKMLEAIDDIVWSINPKFDGLENIAIRIQVFAAEVLEARGIRFLPDIPENSPHFEFPMEKRRQFYLIFKEALINLARHSECTEAGVRLAVDGRTLTLAISDNGQGFERSTVIRGNGLGNMEKRAAAIGGSLVISSIPGRGTTVTLVVTIT